MGVVTDVVKRYVPASYRAIVGNTDYDFSINDLQSMADFIQFRTFATIVGATQEGVYGIEQKELLGLLTTLWFIPTAIEYWGDQLESESLTGTNEVISYYDRRDSLWKLFTALQNEATQLAIDIGVNINPAKAYIPKVSYGDNGRHILRTPDPLLFPPQGAGFNSNRWPFNFNDPGV